MALNKRFLLLRKYIKYKNREPLKLEGSRIIYIIWKQEEEVGSGDCEYVVDR